MVRPLAFVGMASAGASRASVVTDIGDFAASHLFDVDPSVLFVMGTLVVLAAATYGTRKVLALFRG